MDRDDPIIPVDLDLLELSTDGDREIQRELIREFIPACEVRFAAIRKLLGEDNPVAIRNEAIAITAGSGVVGAVRLAELSRVLERCAERCDIVAGSGALDLLETEFELVREFLRQRLAVA